MYLEPQQTTSAHHQDLTAESFSPPDIELDPQAQAELFKAQAHWVRQFKNKVIAIKVGGSTLEPEHAAEVECMGYDISALRTFEIFPVVSFGGGKHISRALTAAGFETNKREGLRVTPAEHLPIIERVLDTEVSNIIASSIRAADSRVIPLSGTDVFEAEIIDFNMWNYVGKVTSVNDELIRTVIAGGAVPLVSTLGRTANGQVVNINGDDTAAALAMHLEAERFIAISDTALRADVNDPATRISSATPADIDDLLHTGVIDSGMAVKVKSLCEVVASGKVAAASIVASDTQHRILVELFTDGGIGTQIVPNES